MTHTVQAQTVNELGAKTGDVLTSTWGYDHTNYTYYTVVKATKKTITVQRDDTGEIFTRRVQTYKKNDGSYSIAVDSYRYAYFNPLDPQAQEKKIQETAYATMTAYAGR